MFEAWLGRMGAPVALLGVVGLIAFFAFPYDLGFLTRILIMMIFVLSIDLVLGYGCIATLGQAAMYGTGAYAAGLFAVHISANPLLGLLIGAGAGAGVAFLSGLIVLRAHGLGLLMLTIAVAQILHEIANKARVVTGGADGLSGIRMAPLFGRWHFDFIGQTGYLYALAVLVLVMVFLRALCVAPLGLTARGIHESPVRMAAIGVPVYGRRVLIYTIAGGLAGLAGALSAQVTALVSLQVFSFSLSAEAVVMLILGGTGRLWGAIFGTAIFMVIHHLAATADPYNWLFVIGILLLGVVYFIPGGLMGVRQRLRILFGGQG